MRSKFHQDEFYQPLLAAFYEETEGFLGEFRQKLETDDLQKAIDYCHKFAGTSATYGFPVLSALLSELEQTLIDRKRNGSDEELETVFSKVEAMVNSIER